jgi:hypothetical protein
MAMSHFVNDGTEPLKQLRMMAMSLIIDLLRLVWSLNMQDQLVRSTSSLMSPAAR